jgi:signal recognition particle subunit SRP54
VHAAVKPIETLFVVDAMLGQDAINTAKAFNDALPLTGVVLTKLDGDSRGGAALSVRHITGKPIKFAGVAEKLDGLEAFDPRAWPTASWAWATSWRWWKKPARAWTWKPPGLAHKIKGGGKFDLNDFKAQLAQMKKMGGLASLLDKLPAQMQAAAGNANMDQAEKQVRRMEGIINSMTPPNAPSRN